MPGYEREWTTSRGMPVDSRLRVGLTSRAGVPERFVVQLEYHHEGEWRPVARFDHDAAGPRYRDVEAAGRHLDVYGPDGEQVAKATTWPPEPAAEAMGRAEDFLRANAHELVQRYERWL